MRRVLRWILGILGGLVALVLVALLVVFIVLQTDWGREKVRVFAEAQLENLIDGDVALGRISGSLFGHFTIEGAAIKNRDGSEPLQAKRLEVDYDLFALLHHKVVVRTVEIQQPYVDLRSPFKLKPRPASTEPSTWVIELQNVRVADGVVMTPKASLARLNLAARVDLGTHARRVNLAQLSGIFIDRGLPFSVHGDIVMCDPFIAAAGVEIIAGASRVAAPLVLFMPHTGGALAVLDASAKEKDVWLFWPHKLLLGDATLAGLVTRADHDAPIVAHLDAHALQGRIQLDATTQLDPLGIRGELHLRDVTSPVPLTPARVDLDGDFDLSGRSLATLHGNLDLAAKGTVARYSIESLKVATVLGGGVARTDVTATMPSAQATAHVDLRLGDLYVEAARLDAGVGNLGRALGRRDLAGSVDLHARLQGSFRDPRGEVNVDGRRLAVGKTALGRVRVHASLPGGRAVEVDAHAVSRDLQGRLLARVALEDQAVAVTMRKLDAVVKGLDVRSKHAGLVMLEPGGHLVARDLVFTSSAGEVELDGDLARSAPALPTGRMHVHIHDLDLAKLRATLAPKARAVAGKITADLHLKRQGTEIALDGDIVGDQVLVGSPRVPPLDFTTHFNLGAGRLLLSGHVRAPSKPRSAGVADFAVVAKVPHDVTNAAAWKRIDIEQSLNGARLSLRDMDLGVAGDLFGRPGLEGRLDGTILATPGARAVDVDIFVRGLGDAPRARNIDVHLVGRWDHEALAAKLGLSTTGQPLLDIDGRLALGLNALLKGADLPRVPIHATVVASGVPMARLRQVLPTVSKQADGRYSIEGFVQGTPSDPRATISARLDDATLGGVVMRSLWARANLDRARIEGSVAAVQQGGGRLDARVLVNRLAANAIDARVQAVKLDLAFLSALATKKNDMFAGAGGKLDADLALKASGRVRETSGMLVIHGGSIYTPSGIAGLVHDIELSARLGGGRLTLDKLTGESASGSLSGSGEVQLGGDLMPSFFRLHVAMNKFPVAAGSMTVSVSTDLQASGRAGDAGWEMEASARGTRIRVPEERREGEKVQSVGELLDVVYVDDPDYQRRTALMALTGTPDLGEKGGMSLRLKLKTPGGVRVSGRELDLLLGTNLVVAYEDGMSHVGGAVEANRGFIELFKRRYDVLRANASFDEHDRINPHLDVRLAHEFRTTTLYIHVGGTMEKPTLELSADPGGFDQAQLLGWVIGGDPDDPTVGKRPLGDQAFGMASNMVLGQVQQLVRTALPIDVLSVHVGEGSDTQTTRFEVGKWLSENLFLGYIYRLNAPDDKNLNEAEVQYRLGPRWLLEAFFGDRGVAGADVIWSKKY